MIVSLTNFTLNENRHYDREDAKEVLCFVFRLQLIDEFFFKTKRNFPNRILFSDFFTLDSVQLKSYISDVKHCYRPYSIVRSHSIESKMYFENHYAKYLALP